jgi:hypothetical protein
MRIFLSLLVVTLACGGATKPAPTTFRDLLRHTGTWGKLPRDLDRAKLEADIVKPYNEHVYIEDSTSRLPSLPAFVSFSEVSDGKICFEYRSEGPIDKSGPEYMQLTMERVEFVLDVLPNLDAVHERPIWPWKGTPLTADKSVDVEDKYEETDVGKVQSRHFTFSMCGEAPTLKDTDKHLVIVMHSREAVRFTDGTSSDEVEKNHGVLLWDLVE